MKRIRTAEPNQPFTHGPTGESFVSDENGYAFVPDLLAKEMTETHGARYATDDERDSLTVTEPKPGQFVVTTADGTPVHEGYFDTRSIATMMAQHMKPPTDSMPISNPTREQRASAAETLARGTQVDMLEKAAAIDANAIGNEQRAHDVKQQPEQVPFPPDPPAAPLAPPAPLTPVPPPPPRGE